MTWGRKFCLRTEPITTDPGTVRFLALPSGTNRLYLKLERTLSVHLSQGKYGLFVTGIGQ